MYGEHVRLKYRDIDDLMTYEFVFFDYGDDEESWCISVSYTHLDVYKRQHLLFLVSEL